MKNLKGILLLMLITGAITAQNFPTGKSLLDKIDDNMSSKTRIITAEIEINSARGARTMVSKSWTEGADKSFTEYLAPVREKGTKMLKLNNQLWIYSPSTDRILQISGHMLRQSVMGSDMSYEDMMSDRPLLEQYKADVTGTETLDGINCWVVQLTAIVTDVNYATQKMWVDQAKFVPVKVELYAKSAKLLKMIKFSDVKKVRGKWYPMTFEYKDMLKSGKGTKFIIREVELDAVIPAHVFNKSSLK